MVEGAGEVAVVEVEEGGENCKKKKNELHALETQTEFSLQTLAGSFALGAPFSSFRQLLFLNLSLRILNKMSAESSPSSAPETKDNNASASADEFDFDLVVLGAGSGGTRAARWAASQYGARVACVELPFGFVPSDEVGGAGGT